MFVVDWLCWSVSDVCVGRMGWCDAQEIFDERSTDASDLVTICSDIGSDTDSDGAQYHAPGPVDSKLRVPPEFRRNSGVSCNLDQKWEGSHPTCWTIQPSCRYGWASDQNSKVLHDSSISYRGYQLPAPTLGTFVPQIQDALNVLCMSQCNPSVSAVYEELNEAFDYTKMPMPTLDA